MKRNKYDFAYVIGYHNGYHLLDYDNQYDAKAMPQYNIKYKHGYIDGRNIKIREEREGT